MSKKFFVLMMLLAASITFANEMFLVEDYVDHTVKCPYDVCLTKIEIDLPISAFLIISGGNAWLKINNDSIEASYCRSSYMIFVEAGSYIIEGWYDGRILGKDTAIAFNPLLQVMVFLRDSTSSVCEPPQENDPAVNPRGILATGNIVHVEGCSEVYDLSGQKVDCSITNGDIQLNALPAGTYFARRTSGHTTKIVKGY